MAKLKATESQEQTALFEWAEWNGNKYPELELLYHIPNGGLRNKATASRLKREGVKAGVPDICLPAARQGYHGLYIELKAVTGRITGNQAHWINRLENEGYYAVVAYGFEEARVVIEWYINGVNTSV